MSNLLIVSPEPQALQLTDSTFIPTLFTKAGEQASYRFVEFFTATIPNANTRKAYFRAVQRLSDWCELHGLELTHLNPVFMAKYIQELGETVSAPTVKQHLAAIRMLFDYLVTGHVLHVNPATAVKGPKYVIHKGKTPVLTALETRDLLDSIPIDTIGGLRDRALIGVMTFSFARVGAVAGMDVGDYFQKGRRHWLRLHEKGGKYHEMPAHHNIEEYVGDYLDEAGIAHEKKKPLFRTLNRKRQLSENRINRFDVFQMIRRRARQAKLSENICCHTFRGTGITVYLQNGGSLEVAQQMAAHSSPETTKLYDRTSDEISLDEVERIII
ncbi:MAG: tyrosine-type recombinase/integrase [Caldilineaceae bacterium]|nr:tyrosine-type recombinase/integrase [Caldilineaceae bacterium]